MKHYINWKILGPNYKGQITILLTKINSCGLIDLALCNFPYLVDSSQLLYEESICPSKGSVGCK